MAELPLLSEEERRQLLDLAPRIVYNKGFAGNTSGDAMRDARFVEIPRCGHLSAVEARRRRRVRR